MIRLFGYAIILLAGLTGQLSAQSFMRDNLHSQLSDPREIIQENSQASDSMFSSENSNTSGFVLGAVLGAPSGISVVGGFSFNEVGVRVSGGSWGKNWNGVQSDISYGLIHSSSYMMSLSVIAGRFQNKSTNNQQVSEYVQQKYFGLAYDMDLAGFFLQAGLATGSGGYSNAQFTFQFGYLWKL